MSAPQSKEIRDFACARVKILRENQGLTQVEVAKRLGVARQTYLDIESGKSDPRLSLMVGLSRMFGVDISVFVDSRINIGDASVNNISTQRLLIESISRVATLSADDRHKLTNSIVSTDIS